jgi:hypothetical protein
VDFWQFFMATLTRIHFVSTPVKHLVVSGDEGIFASKELRAASPLHPLAVCGFTVTVI